MSANKYRWDEKNRRRPGFVPALPGKRILNFSGDDPEMGKKYNFGGALKFEED